VNVFTPNKIHLMQKGVDLYGEVDGFKIWFKAILHNSSNLKAAFDRVPNGTFICRRGTHYNGLGWQDAYLGKNESWG
jgi:hypothetical protein